MVFLKTVTSFQITNQMVYTAGLYCNDPAEPFQLFHFQGLVLYSTQWLTGEASRDT